MYKEVSLDLLVGGDGESDDVVLPCREGLDRALPADLRMHLSKETIGGEIVDRDRDHIPFDRPHPASPDASLRLTTSPLQDVVRQDPFLDIPACAEQPAGRCERLWDFGDDSGGPRIASFELIEVSRWRA